MAVFHVLSVLVTSLMTSHGVSIGSVVDLTYELSSDSLFWPGQPPFNFTNLQKGYYKKYNSWLEYNFFATAEHGGTHIDAPAHFSKGKWQTHEIPPANLIGPGVVIDVTDKVKVKEDYAVTVDDLKNWEEKYGRIPDGAVVIMRSGWGERYPDPKRMFNTDTPDDPSTYRFPGFHEDTARWIVEQRKVIALGGDTPSPDVGSLGQFPVHKILNANSVILLEYVAHVEKLPPAGSTIIIGVMNLRHGSGGHARLLGIIDGSAGLRATNAWMLLVLMAVLYQNC